MLAQTTQLIGLPAADYAVIVIYMIGTMMIGFRFRRGDGSTAGYLLGGRSILWWVAGISYMMTLLSTISLVAIPGEAYNNGVILALQTVMIPIVGLIAFHLFVRFYFQTRAFTPFDYLERRFDARIRALAAGFYWLTRMIYLGLVLYATAIVFEGACGWPKHVTILLAGGVGVAYTAMGGLRAVAWTDLVQFFVLVAGMTFLIGKVLLVVPGGAIGILQFSFEHGRGMPELADPAFYGLHPFMRVSLIALILFVANDHLYYNSADQMSLQRLLSTSSYSQARRSLIWCFCLQVPVILTLWFVGLAIFTFYALQPAESRPVEGDLALFQFIARELPTPLSGIMIAAMLAAVMSTLSSGFNSLATVITMDFHNRFFSRSASEARQVLFSRLVTIVVGLVSIGMGLALTRLSEKAGTTMLGTSFAWLSTVAALPPVFLLGVFSRRANHVHALVVLVIGLVVTAGMIVLYNVTQGTEYPLTFMVIGIPGPVLALTVGLLISRFSPRRSAELADLTLWTLKKQTGFPVLTASR